MLGAAQLYISSDANRSVSTSYMCGKRVSDVMAAPGAAEQSCALIIANSAALL
jgi:hypothetical protein